MDIVDNYGGPKLTLLFSIEIINPVLQLLRHFYTPL